MKRVIKLSLISFLSISSLYATNGDEMIATGAKSMGMGGAGIALGLGAESALQNPALLTKVNRAESAISATLFFPEIETKMLSSDYSESDSKFYLIPSGVYAKPLSDHLYGAIGVWGVAGMGVDFSDANGGSGLMKMQTNLMLMHIATPVAYRDDNGFSVGIAPIIQVGMLDIEYDRRAIIGGSKGEHPYDKDIDANFGAKLGLTYDFDNGLSVGFTYLTPIKMSYEHSGSGSDLKLQQPAEYAAGIAYRYGPHSFAFDIKDIDWDKADGYREFGWRSQTVYAVGYQYDAGEWSARVGYNYAKSAVTGKKSSWQNYLNLLGFPATAERHYTAGFSYRVNENCDIDIAAVYAPRVTKSGVIAEGGLLGDVDITNRHKELSLTIQADYRF